jgi:hypothetical protein
LSSSFSDWDPVRRTSLIRAMFVIGLLSGVTADILTWIVARDGPQATNGEPWSFRGNGALVVPACAAAAVLAGGWTALVLRYRSVPHWQILGATSGFAGAGLGLAGVLVLVVFGSAAQRASDWLFVGSIGWMMLAPLFAMLVPAADHRDGRELRVHLAAAVTILLALVVGFMASGVLLPPGS